MVLTSPRQRTGAVDVQPREVEASRVAVGQLFVIAAVVVVAAAVGWFVAAGGPEVSTSMVVALLASPAAVALGLTAAVRFEWFVWVCLVIRPTLDVAGSDGVGPGAMLAAAFTAASILWLVVQYRSGDWQPMSPVSIALAIFMGAVLLAVVTSQLRSVSVRSAFEILAGITMFLVLEQLLRARRDRVRAVIGSILLGSIIPVTYALIQWATGDFVGSRTDVGRIRSTFVHPNPFATYLVLVTLLVVALVSLSTGRRRVLLAGYAGVLGFVLVLTYNRSGWIALVIGLIYFGLRSAKWVLGMLAVGAIVVAIAVPGVGERLSDLGGDEKFAYVSADVPDNSYEWRLQYWESLIPLANDNPLTGIGPQVVVNTRAEALEPHNVFVQTYVELGVLGLGALALAVVRFGQQLSARRGRTRWRDDRALATAGVAMGLAVLAMSPSENLLNQTMAWWFFAACALWGWDGSGPVFDESEPRARRRRRSLVAAQAGRPT